jgi:hypothetical protein
VTDAFELDAPSNVVCRRMVDVFNVSIANDGEHLLESSTRQRARDHS